MYELFLALHNVMRWVVLVFALLALYRAITGWLMKKPWTEADRKTGLFFGISIDVQLLLGLILYFVYSPWALKAVSEQGMAFVMKQGEYRFFVVEHLSFMVLAVVFAHLGTLLPKKAQQAALKHQRALIFFVLTVLVLMLGIPWGRPLFPNI